MFELGLFEWERNEMSNKMRIAQPEKNKNNMKIQEILPTSSPDIFEHDTNDDRQQVLSRKRLLVGSSGVGYIDFY